MMMTIAPLKFCPIWAALVVTIFIQSCFAIELRHVGVPSFAVQGRNAVLECDYDLEGQALYSVKWYKNGIEFFRYLPSRPQAITFYVRPGVIVDNEQSNARQVTLTQLTQQSTGRYRCEVSTEAPSFATVSSYGDLQVVVLPKGGPNIDGGKQRYSIGDTVNLNCSSVNSKPAADLFWSINGDPVDEAWLIKYPPTNTSGDLHKSMLGLKFVAMKEHFNNDGDIKLKCTASIGSVYWQSNEKSAEGYKQKRASYGQSDGSFDKKDGYPPALDSPHGLFSDNSVSQNISVPLLVLTSIILAKLSNYY